MGRRKIRGFNYYIILSFGLEKLKILGISLSQLARNREGFRVYSINMPLNQCGYEKTIEDSMEESSSMFVDSYAKKRKAEFDPEEEAESDGENEEGSDGKAKIEEPKVEEDYYLKVPDWDVDSFNGLEYCSSPEPILSSDDEPLSEEAMEHYRIYKRQIIESKVRLLALNLS